MSEKLTSWEAVAPSNVALIKYAGKKDTSNLPLNSSFSYTLDHLVTKVRITKIDKQEDCWEPLDEKDFFFLELSNPAIERFLNFFRVLKEAFQIQGCYLIQSANNFPASAGAASSASSFCALTRATHQMALSCSSASEQVESFTTSCLSILSRQGSGSSCRSFFGPWALWSKEQEGARPIALPFSHLIHQLILPDSKSKKVSSSEGHSRVLQSSFFEGRIERAENRLSALLSALNEQNWRKCFEITWEEFQDLHQLYETSQPPIFYRTEKSYNILNTIKTFWEKEKDGPLVTMDAGSSVHLLYRPDQKQMAFKIFNPLSSQYKVLSSV